ncbi:hypothetical protein IGI04_038749 [Brassica rapa subsp. trilocularis]|uniref:Legume lectin domain-containing protein n=2 Tax=Brassica TaxID=3705 RepID=A0ABQ8C983_BRANA|nr:hypothetical protein IGI04_038749 [Brassica rapa subsp. trilocularis]KAH0913327.1 hypothetical protein HID58_036648 [Brassica napus]
MQIQNLCLLALFVAIFSYTTSAARFNFNHFDGSNLVFLGDAELGSTADGSSLSGALSMTRDTSRFSHGQGKYASEIPFKPSNSSSTTYSFKTSFTFSISPRRKTNPAPGHGLAFIVVPTIDNDGAAGKGFLGLGDKYKSWVEYDNVTKLVTVTIAPAYLSKPKKPLIETQIDLSKVFLGNMFTGFSGSMGREVERHDIWTWRFENNAPKETKPVQSG